MPSRGSSQRLLKAVVAKCRPGVARSLAVTLVSLRARREDLGISQEELATRLGCSREHLNRLENDQRKASAEFLFQWGHQLGGEVSVTFPVTSEGG